MGTKKAEVKVRIWFRTPKELPAGYYYSFSENTEPVGPFHTRYLAAAAARKVVGNGVRIVVTNN